MRLNDIISFMLLKNMKDRKGQFGAIQNMILGLMFIVIIIGISFTLMGKFYTQVSNDSGATSDAAIAVNSTIAAAATIPTWLTIIVLVAIAVILLAMLGGLAPRGGSRV